MIANPFDISRVFDAASDCTRVESFAASSLEVDAGTHRLEGAFYGSDGYRAVQRMKQSAFKQERLGACADVLWFGPFGRSYVGEPDAGVPFLSSSEMMEARPSPKNFISSFLTKDLQRIVVHVGTILVSRSGTIGNIAICTADMADMAVSEHAIRVIPKSKQERGVLYAFLQSEVGQFLLTRSKSGSVIESLYEDDVSGLPVPLLPRALRNEMTRLLDEFCDLKVAANELLTTAESKVAHACYLDQEPAEPTLQDYPVCFTSGCVAVSRRDLGRGDVRLDATAYVPWAVSLRNTILNHRLAATLGEVTENIYRVAPGKRTYVEHPSDGLPLLGGKQMMHWRPSGTKYLSRMMTVANATETLSSGTTLVAAGGTIGRTMFIHRNYEDSVASEDVMRLVPNIKKLFPGYLYSFMSSPFGQVQLQQRTFGSVVPRIRHFQFPGIALRVPEDRGEAIHADVVRAFDARADARELEEQLINLFDAAMQRGRAYIENEWGKEY